MRYQTDNLVAIKYPITMPRKLYRNFPKTKMNATKSDEINVTNISIGCMAVLQVLQIVSFIKLTRVLEASLWSIG